MFSGSRGTIYIHTEDAENTFLLKVIIMLDMDNFDTILLPYHNYIFNNQIFRKQ